jgi:hypothetical protein
MFIRQVLFINNAGVTTLEGTVQTIGTDIISAGMIGSDITITANDANDCLQVDVTGISDNVNWTVNVKGVISIY